MIQYSLYNSFFFVQKIDSMNASRKCYDIEKTKMILFFSFQLQLQLSRRRFKGFSASHLLTCNRRRKKYLNKFSVFNSVFQFRTCIFYVDHQTNMVEILWQIFSLLSHGESRLKKKYWPFLWLRSCFSSIPAIKHDWKSINRKKTKNFFSFF